MARRPEGGVGGRGEGGSRRGPRLPCPAGVAGGPRPSPPSSPAHPPLVYMFSRGCWAAPGTGHGLAGRRWVSLAGGGGGCQCTVPPGTRPGGHAGRGAGRSLCRGLLPRLLWASTKAGRLVCAPPSMLHSWVSPSCCGPRGALERRRRAAGRQRALRVGGRLGALGARLCLPQLWRPSPGCRGPFGGAGAGLLPFWPASGRPRTGGEGGGGRRGGGTGGSPQSPPRPLAPPPGGRGLAAWWFPSRGARRRQGGRSLPLPPSIFLMPDPRSGPRSGPPLSSFPPRGAGWPGGGRGGRRVLGAAVEVSG